MANKTNLLLIYTGGTIGMIQDPKTQSLVPFNFRNLTEQVPELSKFDIQLSSIAFEKPIDSSNMHPSIWIKLAEIIKKNYAKYDGFVILHGSDTMAFTASALSFMLENLNKPVILTGSQLPIGIIRTDGKENLITAIEIAAAKKNGKSIVNEVAIYFEYQLFRGNRTHKYNSEHFDAFETANYPPLAEAGVHINYNQAALLKPTSKKLAVSTKLDYNIALLKIYPGITEQVVNALLSVKGLKAVIIETFGSGNAPTETWFIDALKKAIVKDAIVYNVTQCNGGSVIQGKYETSKGLQKIGVVSGFDITTEAAVCKLMYLLGKGYPMAKTKALLSKNLRGEITA